MQKFKRRKSITTKMWSMFLVVLFLFTCAFVGSGLIIIEKSKYDYEIREAQTIVSGVSSGIENVLENYKDLSRIVMLNENVITFLRAEQVDTGLINDTKFGVLDVMNVSQHLDSIQIFRNDGTYMNTGRGVYLMDYERMDSDEWKNTILDKRGGALIFTNANDAIHKENGTPIVTVARSINDIYTQEQAGILLMNFSTGMLERFAVNQQDTKVCVVSLEGECLAGDESILPLFTSNYVAGELMYEERGSFFTRSLVSSYHIPDTPLIIFAYTSSSMGKAVPTMTINAMIMLLAAYIFGIFAIGHFTFKNVTKPVLQLADAMERTKESGWLEKLDVKMPDNEMGFLADNYNSMIEYLNRLFTELIEKEKSIQKAELLVLQEQIKPHFLYNSMETISYMALNAGAGDVHDALETLGNFYRNFLSKGEKEIPLSREIRITKDYLAIQKLRYGDIICDEYNVDDSVLDVKIPKLILQPLVENSIYHGIRLKGEPGVIRISAYEKDGELHISVYDTGMGMDQETIDTLLASGSTGHSSDGTDVMSGGFGLRGTIDRVRYYCGQDHVVRITGEPGEFSQIEFIIPMHTDENRGKER